MAGVNVADRPAIGDHVAMKSPFVSQEIKELFAGAGGNAVDSAVRAHHRICFSLYNRCPKRWRVGVGKVVRTWLSVKFVTPYFGPAMDGVMLRCRNDLEILRIIAL